MLQESNNLKRGDPEDTRLAAIKDMDTLRKEQVRRRKRERNMIVVGGSCGINRTFSWTNDIVHDA